MEALPDLATIESIGIVVLIVGLMIAIRRMARSEPKREEDGSGIGGSWSDTGGGCDGGGD